MRIDICIDEEKNIAKVAEVSDKGTKKEKLIPLENFLQKYTSFLKEKEDDITSVYFPPGYYDYYKNINSMTYVVQTFNYKEFYEVEDLDKDFVVVVKTNLTGNRILGASVYSTRGIINKTLSRFVKIIDIKDNLLITDVDNAVKYCIRKAKETTLSGITKRLKYSEII